MTRLFPFDTSVAQALPALVTIEQGGVIIRFTTWGHNVVITTDSVDYLYAPWPGSDVTGLQYPSDGTPANADVVLMAMPNTAIQPGDGVRGMLDNWPITVELFDPGDLTAGTFVALAGTIGSVLEDTRGMITIAANGQLRLAAERSMTEKYSLTGRESLGDNRCKIPICCGQDILAYDIGRDQDFVRPDFADGTTGLINVTDAYGRVKTGVAGTAEDYANVYYECTVAGTTASVAPIYNPAVGTTTVDGTATFIARNAWTRYAVGRATSPYTIRFDALPDPRGSDATWFAFGELFIRSGIYAGFPGMGINEWDPATYTATLYLPIVADGIPVGTQIEIHVGCDQTNTLCLARFDNVRNRRAEDLVPPPETINGL